MTACWVETLPPMVWTTYRWLFISLACIGLVADQVSKYAVFGWLYREGYWSDGHGNSYDVLPGWFKLVAQYDLSTPLSEDWRGPLQRLNAPVMPRVNHGALFGMGQSHRLRANTVFAVVSGLAAVVIVLWGWRCATARDLWLSMALGLILGGTLGNLYDRLVFFGVRDFLYFYKIDWPVFNVADCCLVCGATLLFFHAFFLPIKPAEDLTMNQSSMPATPAVCGPDKSIPAVSAPPVASIPHSPDGQPATTSLTPANSDASVAGPASASPANCHARDGVSQATNTDIGDRRSEEPGG